MWEKLVFGLSVTVICLCIVFLVLIGLSYIIRLQRVIIEKIEGNKKAVKPMNKQVNITPPIEKVDDGEIVAVITAAIAAALGKSTSSIVVKSIRKMEPDAPVWTIAGRQEQLNNRL